MTSNNPCGIILSTSEGLVTDSTWKCIDNETAESTPYNTWPKALVLGTNGGSDTVYPWGLRPGILPTAKWIWAQATISGNTPEDVVCSNAPGNVFSNIRYIRTIS